MYIFEKLINNIKTDKMINFASLFNQFRMNNSIGDLVDAPGATIDRLLDEDSFLNQFKSGNSKVLQFMKYDKFKTLVKYVTEVGPAEDRKRSYKYPLSACDFLSADSTLTIDFFFGDAPIIVKEQVIVEPEQKKQVKEEKVQEEKQGEKKVIIDDKIQKVQENPATTPTKTAETTETAENAEEVKPQMEAEQNTQQANAQNKETQESVEQPKPQVQQIERVVEPLRIALFSYFEGEVNYTLAGYVCKIFSTFHTKKPVPVMNFLLEPERFAKLLNHIESRSVGDLIVKLLTHESTDAIDLRRDAFQQLLEKVSKRSEVYIISNLAASICEIIEKIAASTKNVNESTIELGQIFFTPAIITKIISNVMSEEETVSVYNAPILQTYLVNVPLVIPEKSQLIEDLKALLLNFLTRTLQKLKVERDSQPSLGFGRVKIVEIMSFVLKQNILNARELASSETEFFTILFSLCRNYQYNNVLHNEVVKIVEIALAEPEGSPFLALLLKEKVLINFLTEEALEDQKIKSGAGSQKARKGYIGHIVSICRKIQQAGTKNQQIAVLTSSPEFEKVITDLVDKEIYDYNKTLAGYSMKRGQKHNVLFAKDEVIQEHLKFLASTPPPIFQLEPEPVNIEHPDLVQAEKVQTEAAEQTQAVEEAEIIQQQNFNSKFFGVHLEYNVDDLMVDL